MFSHLKCSPEQKANAPKYILLIISNILEFLTLHFIITLSFNEFIMINITTVTIKGTNK